MASKLSTNFMIGVYNDLLIIAVLETGTNSNCDFLYAYLQLYCKYTHLINTTLGREGQSANKIPNGASFS